MKVFGGLDLSPSSSALVILPGDGGVPLYWHFSESDVKKDMLARFRMSQKVFAEIRNHLPTLLALEDYDLSPTQQVGYQIAEVAGLVKYMVLEAHLPLALVAPRKLKSYVKRQKVVEKKDVMEFASTKLGFNPPIKTRSQPGFYQREREDLADARVLAEMAKQLDVYLSEGAPPKKKGDIFLDPDFGLAHRSDLLFNNPYEEELGAWTTQQP